VSAIDWDGVMKKSLFTLSVMSVFHIARQVKGLRRLLRFNGFF